MKEKTTQIFDKTIHDLKASLHLIAVEKQKINEKVHKLLREHELKVNKIMKKIIKTIEELYELYLNVEEETKE